MDFTAALTPPEIAALSDAERVLEEASRLLHRAYAEEHSDLSLFEDSLRLKITLDTYEEQARSRPSWKALSVLVNCEYLLYFANKETPLRMNPFLSHWVEAIQRLDAPLSHVRPSSRNGKPSSSDIHTVRVELIKGLLQTRNPSQFAWTSPKALYADYVELQQKTDLDVGVYVRMLEEEGIYERTPEPADAAADSSPSANHVSASAVPKQKETARPKLSDFQRWKLDILEKIRTEPHVAVPELTHLPVELSYLDFLTTLLQDKTLEACSIESPPVISDYIQHALRLTEVMGEPPDSSLSSVDMASGSSSSSTGANGQSDQILLDLDRGREAQTRAVKLLLLFIKNMIRKALVPIEAIYFEIQEICVRYVWIKEVREFRAFVEEGQLEGWMVDEMAR